MSRAFLNSGTILAPKVVKWRAIAAGLGDEGGLFRAGALDFSAVVQRQLSE